MIKFLKIYNKNEGEVFVNISEINIIKYEIGPFNEFITNASLILTSGNIIELQNLDYNNFMKLLSNLFNNHNMLDISPKLISTPRIFISLNNLTFFDSNGDFIFKGGGSLKLPYFYDDFNESLRIVSNEICDMYELK